MNMAGADVGLIRFRCFTLPAVLADGLSLQRLPSSHPAMLEYPAFCRTCRRAQGYRNDACHANADGSVSFSEADRGRVATLEKVLFAGAPVSAVVLARAIERFGNIFIHGFGTTETVGSISILRLPDLQEALDSGNRKALKSCGRGYTDMEVEVVNDTRSRRVAPNTIGEVRVRGKGVSQGYWRKEKETRHAFDNGWFYTEDLAVVDENGFISIVGRMKDMIISGAENVFPAEVENVLLKHPAVYQAAVVGVENEKWGEPLQHISS